MLRSPEFDPRRALIVEADEWAADEACAADMGPSIPGGSSKITLVSAEATRVTLEVDTDTPGYVVLGDAWYPGWQVTWEALDGSTRSSGPRHRTQPALRANLLFLAAPIAHGHWRLEFSFVQRHLGSGVVLSVLGLLALSLYAVYTARHPD